MKRIFITGIGTGVGKTLVAAIVARALDADYWKPVQAGYATGTDSEWVKQHLTGINTVIPEVYKLKMAASPHIAARSEGIKIALNKIEEQLPLQRRNLIIEGPGGVLVPLNESEFVADLIKQLHADVILVSRNYLGSINHSLLTAEACKRFGLPVIGWIFNDQYLNYEDEIVKWSGLPKIASVPYAKKIDGAFITQQASAIRMQLATYLC